MMFEMKVIKGTGDAIELHVEFEREPVIVMGVPVTDKPLTFTRVFSAKDVLSGNFHGVVFDRDEDKENFAKQAGGLILGAFAEQKVSEPSFLPQ